MEHGDPALYAQWRNGPILGKVIDMDGVVDVSNANDEQLEGELGDRWLLDFDRLILGVISDQLSYCHLLEGAFTATLPGFSVSNQHILGM